MLDIGFCEFLEYEISKALSNYANDKVRHFWCDGILLPTFDNEYSRKFVHDNKKVKLTAFIGPTGQDKYELTLYFGDKALSKYASDLDISVCFSNSDNNWFDIDFVKRKISIQLD